MKISQQIVTVVGGSGFLGRYVVKELAQAGYTVRVLCRHPELAEFLKPNGHVGQIIIQKGDLAKPETLEGKLAGSFAVINLVGLLFERGRQKFKAVHQKGAGWLAGEARKHQVERFIQVSALGVSDMPESDYARTKVAGEEAVKKAFINATIFRPSVLFGPEDNFFNQFARQARILPFLPLVGGGKTKFQPIYAGDVARAIVTSLQKPETKGQTYELGGSQVMTMKEIYEYVLEQTGHERALVNLPFCAASTIGTFAQLLPTPPLTPDQVRMLKHDNVVHSDAKILADLAISPTPIDMIVPHYLKRYESKRRVTVEPE